MRLFFPLSGDDVFISYSRRDGALYAAGLADTLTRKNLSCFIDKLGTEPNHDLPPSLRKKIKNCTIFVIIGTEKAAQSEFVGREITEFKQTGRTILPIDFNGAVGSARWYDEIPGLATENEKIARLKTGNPSKNVVNFVEKSFNYTRRNQFMFRLFWGALSLFLILMALGVGAFIFAQTQITAAKLATQKANDATDLANQKEAEATQKKKEAEDANRAAEEAKKQAQEASDLAEKQKLLADAATKKAEEKTKIADAATRRAEEQTLKAAAASKKADEQTRRADEQTQRAEKAQQLVEKGRSTIAQNYYSIAQTSYLTEPLQAFPWSQKAIETAAETDENQELYKLWALNLTRNMPQIVFNSLDGISYEPVYDRQNNYAATVSEAGKLTLWNLKTGERKATPLDAEACNCPVMPVVRFEGGAKQDRNYNPIFSPDGKYIAVLTVNARTFAAELHIWEVETGVETPMEGLSGSSFDAVFNFKFSPDSKFIYLDDVVSQEEVAINVLDAKSGKLVSKIKSRHFKYLEDSKRLTGIGLPASENPERNWILTFEGDDERQTAVVRNIATGEQIGEKILLPDKIGYINFTGNAEKIVMLFQQENTDIVPDGIKAAKFVQMITARDIEKNTSIEPVRFGLPDEQKIIGFSKDGNRLLVDNQFSFLIWDLKEKRVATYFDLKLKRKDLRAEFTDDEKHVVTLAELPDSIYPRIKQDIRIFDAENGKLNYQSNETGNIKFSPDGEMRYQRVGGRILAYRNQNVAESSTTTAKQLSLGDGECIFKIMRVPNQKTVLSLSFSACPIATADKPVESVIMRLWDLETALPKWNKAVVLGTTRESGVNNFNFGEVFFDESGKSFITMIPESAEPAAGEERQKELRMWETESGNEVQSFVRQRGFFKAVSLSVARNRIITVAKNEAANIQADLRNLNGSLQENSYLGEFPPQTHGEFLGLTKSGDEAIFSPMQYINSLNIQTLDNAAPEKIFSFGNAHSQSFAAECLVKADKIVWDDKNHIRAIFDAGFSFLIADSGKIELIPATGNAVEVISPKFFGDFSLQFAMGGKLTIKTQAYSTAVFETKTGFPFAEKTAKGIDSGIIYSEILPNQNTLLLIESGGKIKLWNFGVSTRKQPFWAKEMGEALSGLRVINDTQTQMLSQEEYLKIRKRYIETLKRKASEEGDAEAQAILDNWNP